jgi:apolipoprotein N-acyltransferase
MRRNIFLSLFSAILLILSFPNFNIWIVSWFAFVPLFFAMEYKRPLQVFLLSYLTGIIFFLGVIYWLYHVSILGLILLILYLAIYFGLFGLFLSYITHQTSHITQLFFIPSIWVLLEYVRSRLFTGFGWVLLGYSQYLNLPIIQIADITGVWGVSFLVMMVNFSIYELIKKLYLSLTEERLTVYSLCNYLISFIFLLIVLGYGFFRLKEDINGKRLKISVIQGNIPQEIKWEEESKDFILNRYLQLTMRAKEDRAHLIIWPEASYPEVLYCSESKEELSRFIEEINIPILLGVVIKDRDLYFNSAILIELNKEEFQRYDKLHLVPFGEYIPLRKIFGFLETIYPIGDFVRGKKYTLFSLAPKNLNTLKPKFSVLICFEDIFPQVSKEFVKRGADFLINITNDAWFGKTSASYQHLQASVFRAVENRRFVVRCANTGISCFINPKGKIISKVEDNRRDIFISGYKTEGICLNKENLTFYTRFGDYFVFLCLTIFGYGIILRRRCG